MSLVLDKAYKKPPQPGAAAPPATSPGETTYTLGNPNDPPPKTFVYPAAPTPAPSSPDPFTAMGGGVQTAGGGWVPKNHPDAVGRPVGPPAPSAVPGAAPPPAAPPPPAAAPGGAQPPLAAAPAAAPAPAAGDGGYKDALVKMLSDGGKTASLEDPALKAQSDAYAVGQTRATEQGRAALAERMAQDGSAGVNSGAFNGELAGLFNQQGENQAGYNAGLVGDAAKQNLSKLTTALSMMGNDRNSAEGRALQAKIAETQAQIQREGLTQGGSQFDRSLSQGDRQFGTDTDLRRRGIENQYDLGKSDLRLRGRLGDSQANLGLLAALLGDRRSGEALGMQGAIAGMNNDSSGILGLLAGLR